MTTEQLVKVEQARTLFNSYSRIEHHTGIGTRAALRCLGDVLDVVDDQQKKLVKLAADVDAYRAGRGIRAHLVRAREENAGLRAQIKDLEAYCIQQHKELSEASRKAAILDRLRGSEPHIRGGDTVLHGPSWETWVIAGVSADGKRVIPAGYPFPSMADAADCVLVECREGGQPAEFRDALRRHGLESFIEPEPVKEATDGGADAPEQATDADA